MGFSFQYYFATHADHKEPVLPALAVSLKMAALIIVRKTFFTLEKFKTI
jgi:hypothetical protein